MKSIKVFVILVGAFTFGIANAETPDKQFHVIDKTRTDRYTLVKTGVKVEQMYPLEALINLSMGRNINTVGEAINEILLGSGYHWEVHEGRDEMLMRLPLPTVARNIGPIQIQDALKTLAGNSWYLRVDNLNRVVWFEVKEKDLASK